jgi:hypothetical protein
MFVRCLAKRCNAGKHLNVLAAARLRFRCDAYNHRSLPLLNHETISLFNQHHSSTSVQPSSSSSSSSSSSNGQDAWHIITLNAALHHHRLDLGPILTCAMFACARTGNWQVLLANAQCYNMHSVIHIQLLANAQCYNMHSVIHIQMLANAQCYNMHSVIQLRD